MSDFQPLALDKIRVLPIELSNQIAAGEVVERPASALRELVENALDAGATRIDVEIEEGGSRLIRVTDNGVGMSASDAERSVQRHATSKILTTEDLFRIASLGFRGEALPSIASVSKFELVTRQDTTIEATRVYIEGGSLKLVEPWSAPVGTSITVRDLFYNTPARQKFLKTIPTEQRRCMEVIHALAIPRPQVSFSLKSKGRTLLSLPAVDNIWTRVETIVGLEDAKHLFMADTIAVDGHETWGFISSPEHTTRTADSVQTFVNGRAVRDKNLLSAVRVGYDTLLDRGRYPKVFLFSNVPFDQIDVNVHPAKTEVRFQNPAAMHASIRRAIRKALADSPWVPSAEASASQFPGPATTSETPLSLSPPQVAEQPGELNLWTGPTRTYRMGDVQPSASVEFSESGRIDEPYDERRSHFAGVIPPFSRESSLDALAPKGSAEADALAPGWFQSLHYIGPLHRLYLLLSDAQGLVIIDQHASHERITFERLRTQWKTRQHPSQPSLMPQVFSLNAIRRMTLSEHLEFFGRLGFEIEAFGDDDFALRATPEWFDERRFKPMLEDVLDDLGETGQSTRLEEVVEGVLSRMACHGSVRAGDALSHGEVRALLEQLDACDFGANCPHGRPVWFRMTLEELELRFHRR